MSWRIPDISEKELFNSLVTHPLQSWEWGEFREKTGVTVIRKINPEATQAFQVTIHKIPTSPFTIGYLPKGLLPTKEMLDELRTIGKENNCLFIKLEPNVEDDELHSKETELRNLGLTKSAHPLFTKYTFQLDLTPSEEELLKNMQSKTRYNTRVAERHGVTVVEDNSEKAFEKYLELTWETTTRQKFYSHTKDYHKTMWETLHQTHSEHSENTLSSHLLTATYQGKILVTWIVFLFNNVLYYPYGASSSENREVMASNLQMWEAIKFGKKHNAKLFDMWGSLGPNPNTRDPWFGFHRFKQGYGARLVEFVGSYDLVLNPVLYPLYNAAHLVRWAYLRLKK